MDALVRDLQQELPNVWGRSVRSIFIGGGTPSLFPAEQIERLLSAVRALVPLGPDLEVTLEANPGAAEQERFVGYREAGVNRLSIGIQSFSNQQLQKIGRVHDSLEALSAVEMAREAGFDRINLDLMFGLPEQTTEQALDDLQQAVALQTDHISWYQLTMEPNTPFGHSPPPLPGEEQLWEVQRLGRQLLESGGLHQYEISAYARSGEECRHNLNYWRFGDYLGIGAGAHAKLTMVADGSILRSARRRNPRHYMVSTGSEEALSSRQQITPSELPLEFMMNALRLTEGFSMQQFSERTGLSPAAISPQIAEAAEMGLLLEGEKIVPTRRGHNFLNELLLLF